MQIGSTVEQYPLFASRHTGVVNDSAKNPAAQEIIDNFEFINIEVDGHTDILSLVDSNSPIAGNTTVHTNSDKSLSINLGNFKYRGNSSSSIYGQVENQYRYSTKYINSYKYSSQTNGYGYSTAPNGYSQDTDSYLKKYVHAYYVPAKYINAYYHEYAYSKYSYVAAYIYLCFLFICK